LPWLRSAGIDTVGGWHAYSETAHEEIDQALRAFNSARIGTKLLGDVLRDIAANEGLEGLERSVGSMKKGHGFQSECNVLKVAEGVAAYVEDICVENVYESPEMVLRGEPVTCDYVPSHVWYVTTELLKNACRFTIDRHGDPKRPGRLPLPPVRIRLERVGTEIRLEVEDSGPGIALEERERIWSYCYTTVAGDGKKLELAGAGVGLSLSQLYTGACLASRWAR